jgi:hypothetical protein
LTKSKEGGLSLREGEEERKEGRTVEDLERVALEDGAGRADLKSSAAAENRVVLERRGILGGWRALLGLLLGVLGRSEGLGGRGSLVVVRGVGIRAPNTEIKKGGGKGK